MMSDYTSGGRGKKAPYQTVMYRIPTAIKPTVEELSRTWKLLFPDPSDWLNQVEAAISSKSYSQPVQDCKAELEHLQQQLEELRAENQRLLSGYSSLRERFLMTLKPSDRKAAGKLIAQFLNLISSNDH